MYLTGFADEAADSLEGQMKATKELGWNHIEARSVDGVNIVDLDEAAFEKVCERLWEGGVRINCFGSTIANWGKSVLDDWDATLAAVERAVVRMNKLDVEFVRIMSYAVLRDEQGRALADQMEDERFRRLREICRRFTDAGLTPVHENCLTYGGMGWAYTLKMLENVPGLKLVYDTGNPPLTPDFAKPYPYAVQSSWEFYRHVKEHIAYVHIKDTRLDPVTGEEVYYFPGDGDGDVARIVDDLLKGGYDGGFSIEPHMAVVFHNTSVQSGAEQRYLNYVEYGRRFMKILEGLGHPYEI